MSQDPTEFVKRIRSEPVRPEIQEQLQIEQELYKETIDQVLPALKQLAQLGGEYSAAYKGYVSGYQKTEKDIGRPKEFYVAEHELTERSAGLRKVKDLSRSIDLVNAAIERIAEYVEKDSKPQENTAQIVEFLPEQLRDLQRKLGNAVHQPSAIGHTAVLEKMDTLVRDEILPKVEKKRKSPEDETPTFHEDAKTYLRPGSWETRQITKRQAEQTVEPAR